MNSALESFQTQLDNPGYMDFNNPTPVYSPAAGNGGRNKKYIAPYFTAAASNQRKKGPRVKQKTKQQLQQQQHLRGPQGGTNKTLDDSWPKNKKNYNDVDGGHRNMRGFIGRRSIPPPIPSSNKRVRGPMHHHLPPATGTGHGFRPPPQPMPLVVSQRMRHVGLLNQPLPPPMPPLYFRRNMPARPPPIPPYPMQMQPPHMPRPFVRPGMPPFDGHNPKLQRKSPKDKGSSIIKTLKNLVNQFPLDKPWVNDEIRNEHDKKIDLENRLKGNKDDDLFGQFKIQRDKFVGLYESAREQYLRGEAAAVKANITA